ncbi:Protein of unknown function [Gryllus bimaculatus]|nr:Protein of unknown function [Gryllus bimaculatus]
MRTGAEAALPRGARALAPLLWVARALGLAPFALRGPPARVARAPWALAARALWALALGAAAAVRQDPNEKGEYQGVRTSLEDVFYYFNWLLFTVLPLAHAVYATTSFCARQARQLLLSLGAAEGRLAAAGGCSEPLPGRCVALQLAALTTVCVLHVSNHIYFQNGNVLTHYASFVCLLFYMYVTMSLGKPLTLAYCTFGFVENAAQMTATVALSEAVARAARALRLKAMRTLLCVQMCPSSGSQSAT